ncbi:hypothetical protein OG937_46170 [Streptomyces sp. NBC_00510]
MPVRDDAVWHWRRDFEANGSASGNARVHTRTQLTMGHWHGDIKNAAQIAARVMDNAARHSSPPPRGRLDLRLAVIATGELLIEVTDPFPDFPGFIEAVTWKPTEGQSARGLWVAQHLGARLSFAVAEDGRSKTVQALVPGTPAC